MTIATPPGPQMPAGWYSDGSGLQRYWDGQRWTEHTAPTAPPGPLPVQPNVRQAADRAQYVRQQRGHSIVKHLLFGWLLAYIPTIYFAVSPNHYFHA